MKSIIKDNIVSTFSPQGEKVLTTSFDYLPIDSFTASLSACITLFTYVKSKDKNIDIKDISTNIERTMNNGKIENIDVLIEIEGSYTPENKNIIEGFSKNTPIGNSLDKNINVKYNFVYKKYEK